MTTDLTYSHSRGVATITVKGNASHKDLEIFRHHLDEALERSATFVAVDLAGVTALDASTLGALISAHHRAVRAGSALALIAPTRPVLRRLEQTNLDGVFPIVDEVPSAWALPEPASGAQGRELLDLLAFIEARALDDISGHCEFCPRDEHLAAVGHMAIEWVGRVRDGSPTERQIAWTGWMAGIHRDHEDYRSSWDRLQTAQLV